MLNDEELVKIYDEMFNLIGTENWSVVHEKGLFHQVVHLWIYSDESDGRWLYFIQRSKKRAVFPELFDLPVSGHIDPEETFSQAVISLAKERLGLNLNPESFNHAGNIRQIIDSDKDNYHDNAFCQVYVQKLTPPLPEFNIGDVEMLFKTRYDDFCRWVDNHEGLLPIYTPEGRLIKESSSDDWWWLRTKEFSSVVKPYIDTDSVV